MAYKRKRPSMPTASTHCLLRACVQSLPEQQPQPTGPPQLPSPSHLRTLLGADASPSGMCNGPVWAYMHCVLRRRKAATAHAMLCNRTWCHWRRLLQQ